MNYVEAGYVRSGYTQLDTDLIGGLIFDPAGKRIVIPDSIEVITADTLYSRSIDWMVQAVAQDTSMKWLPAMRYTGGDPIPTGLTGATFFMTNSWRISYNPNATSVTGVIFSEDYNTAYWTRAMDPVFPITVSAVVNQVTTVQNIVTGDVSEVAGDVWSLINSNSPTPITATEIANAILAAATLDPIHADTKRMNGAPILGTGSEEDKWRGEDV